MVISAALLSGRGAVVIVISGVSLSNAMKTGTSPGLLASTFASIASSGFRPCASLEEGGPATDMRSGSPDKARSEEHTSELQSLMRISYAVFCLKKKNDTKTTHKKN